VASIAGILIWTLVLFLFLVGLIGAVLPVLPCTPFVFVGILIYAWWTGFEVITPPWLIGFGVLTLLSVGLDYLFSVLAPRKMKASWWAVFGAAVGLFVGLFFGLPGILLGPLVGAALFEYIHSRETLQSMGAGISTLVGFILGTMVKGSIAFIMIALFFIRIWTA